MASQIGQKLLDSYDQIKQRVAPVVNFIRNNPTPAVYLNQRFQQRVAQPVAQYSSPIINTIANEYTQGARNALSLSPPGQLYKAATRQPTTPQQGLQGIGTAFQTAFPVASAAYRVGAGAVGGTISSLRNKTPLFPTIQKSIIENKQVGTTAFGSGPLAMVGNIAEFAAPFAGEKIKGVGTLKMVGSSKPLNTAEARLADSQGFFNELATKFKTNISGFDRKQAIIDLIEEAKIHSKVLAMPKNEIERMGKIAPEQLLNKVQQMATMLSADRAAASSLGRGAMGIVGNKVNVQPRGLTQSVQESALPKGIKEKVQTVYAPKPNKQLMGEAKALLQEHAILDIKNVQNIDQKVAATIQKAISSQGTKAGNQEAANLFNNLSEIGTQLGRGVQAYSLLDKMSPEAIALSAAGKIKQYNQTAIRKIPELTGDQVELISRKVSAIRKLVEGSRERGIAVNELANMVSNFIPSSIADKLITVWKAGLLTSFRTHERNLFGNAIMGASEVAKDIPATLADTAMSLRTGKRSTAFTMQGIGEGARKGAQSAVDIARYGYDPQETISKFDVHHITWGNNPVEQFLKRATEAVYRPLSGEDKVFWHSSYTRSLYDQAATEAINQGKRGNKLFIDTLAHNPTEQMAKTALNEANYATFHDTNALSGVASSIKRAAQSEKLGKVGSEVGKVVTEVLAPFTGVPSSIVGKTIAYSPIGLVKGAVNFGRVVAGNIPELQRQAAQEIGRGVIGTGLFGLGAYLMSKGVMTGQPKDLKEAQLWQTENKPSNSVFIGGKWRSINSIGPQNLVMLAGAKYNEEMNKPDGSMGAYVAGLGKDQLSQTFLAGVQGPLNAITDPARYGTSYIGNTAASVVPNIVKDTARSQDKYGRETNTVSDYVKAGIPGVRNTMIPKRDVLGNVVLQQPTGIAAFFDLFNSKTPTDNAVIRELDRLSQTGNPATPSKLSRDQTILNQKVKLTFEQLNNLEANVGQALKPQLEALVGSPNYAKLDDEQKAQAIQKVVTEVRKQVKNLNGISEQAATSSISTSVTQIPIINKNGNVTMIDLKTNISPPKLTGIKELDKVKMSSYKSEITSRIKDIGTLLDNGAISRDEAITQLNQLISMRNALSTGGSKKKFISDAELISAYKKALEAANTPRRRSTQTRIPSLRPIRLKRVAVKSLR